MRKEDLNNKYNTRPDDYKESVNNETGVYTKSGDDDEIKSINKDFVQMNNKYLDIVAELTLTKPVASAIFFLLIKRMENNNTYIVSNKELCAVLKKSEDTIQRAIKVLLDRNFVVVFFRSNHGTCYFVNPQIACKCSAQYKQFLIKRYLDENRENYVMGSEFINVKALVKEDRVVLKNDLKQQLNSLRRPDNVKLHTMLEVFDWFSGKSQVELLQLLDILKGDTSLVDLVRENTDKEPLDLLENMDNVDMVEFIQRFDKKKQDETKIISDNIAHDLKKNGVKEKVTKQKTEEEIAWETYLQEEQAKQEDDDFAWLQNYDVDCILDSQKNVVDLISEN